jgi:hypothetical protein
VETVIVGRDGTLQAARERAACPHG